MASSLSQIQRSYKKGQVNCSKLADEAGLSRSYVNHLMTGRRDNPTEATIQAITKAWDKLERVKRPAARKSKKAVAR